MADITSLDLQLYRRIRLYRRNPALAVTYEDILDYRFRLMNKTVSLNEAESNDLETLNQWIEENEMSFVPIHTSDDDLKKVRLSPGFNEKNFDELLPQFCKWLQRANEWACLFHTLIYFGWMEPVEYMVWFRWLNDRLEANGYHDYIISESNAKNINKSLKSHRREKWTYEEFSVSQESDSTKTQATYKRFTFLCMVVKSILNGKEIQVA